MPRYTKHKLSKITPARDPGTPVKRPRRAWYVFGPDDHEQLIFQTKSEAQAYIRRRYPSHAGFKEIVFHDHHKAYLNKEIQRVVLLVPEELIEGDKMFSMYRKDALKNIEQGWDKVYKV